jgi:Leucine-rich repeat (LRR) protein
MLKQTRLCFLRCSLARTFIKRTNNSLRLLSFKDKGGKKLKRRLLQNGIQSLEADVFRDLNRLSILDLTGANIYNVSDLAFRGLRRLKTLSLAKNALDTLPAVALEQLRQLEDLDLGPILSNFLRP